MGQKANPIGMRVGVNRTWDSRWYAGRDYAVKLLEDLKLRDYIKRRLKPAGIAKVVIERAAKTMRVNIHAARPGLIIGKKGADIETLRRDIRARASGADVSINIIEIRKPEVNAQMAAENVAGQLERRVSFRRAMKRVVQSAMRMGAGGIRLNVAGRLNGADIARTEWYREGQVPLHTLRADIDYGFAEAKTTYGMIGVQVWMYKGEILEHDPTAHDRRAAESQGGMPRG